MASACVGPASAAREQASSCSIRSESSPTGSASVASSSPRMILIRSSVCKISVTPSPVTSAPSRYLPISVSAAWAKASRRGSPKKPHVPLMVCTSRKMLERMAALLGSCSNFTSSTSTTSRLSKVSVRNSRRRSSISSHPGKSRAGPHSCPASSCRSFGANP